MVVDSGGEGEQKAPGNEGGDWREFHRWHCKVSFMSKRIVLASIGCSLMMIAGVFRLLRFDWAVGLLLIGFAGTLWSNVRLRDRLRTVTPPASPS
jgi:hypothetical protein